MVAVGSYNTTTCQQVAVVSGNDFRGGLAWSVGVHSFQGGSLERWLPRWVMLGYPNRFRMIKEGASTGAEPGKAGADGRSPGQGYSSSPLLPQGVRWPMILEE